MRDRYCKPADCLGMPLRPRGERCAGPADAWERGRLAGRRASALKAVGLKAPSKESTLKKASKSLEGLLEHAAQWRDGWDLGWNQPISQRRQRALAVAIDNDPTVAGEAR